MKLRDVDAKIVQYHGYGIYREWAGPINQGHGLEFECPTCLARAQDLTVTNGPTKFKRHKIVCWSVGVPRHLPPLGRWMFYGTSLDDLTIDAPLPTIRISEPCGTEFLVKDGQLTIL